MHTYFFDLKRYKSKDNLHRYPIYEKNKEPNGTEFNLV
jgi:hypothetical protein